MRRRFRSLAGSWPRCAALGALGALACAEGESLEVDNNAYLGAGDASAHPEAAGGAGSVAATGGAAPTAGGAPGGAAGTRATGGGPGGASGGSHASGAGGSSGGSGGNGGSSTAADGGSVPGCAPGQKSCGGLCLEPAPAVGCSLSDCSPCPAVENATLRCAGELCEFECDPGYVEGGSGCTIAPNCTNGLLDGTETDVDCGGSSCPACAPGSACLLDADCDRGPCDASVCGCTPTSCGTSDCGSLSDGCGGTLDCGACPGCDDGVQNGAETGVDCGGTCLDCPWARWALDETSGTTASDSSGNGHDGTLTNFPASPWVTGQLDGALTFDGNDDYVAIGTAAPAGAITITAWINSDSVGDEGRILVSKRDNNQSNRAEFQFGKNAAGVGPTDEMAFSFNVAGTWYLWHTTNLDLSTNTWTHVSVTYAETAGAVFYKNAVAVGATQWAGSGAPARPTNTAETRIGGAVNAPESPWDGELDDVRIYPRVLTAAEITQVMNGG